MRGWVRWAVVAALWFSIPMPLVAPTRVDAEEPNETPPVIRVTGEGTVTAQPDQASIQIGVVTQADNADRAAQQNAEKLDATLAAIRGVLGPDAEIKTLDYSLRPEYRVPKSGGERKIAGYTASNVVQVDTGALGEVGKVVDAATLAGANELRALRFGLRNARDAQARAASEAAASARAKADAVALALGLRIVRVLAVDEGGPALLPQPVRAQRFLAAESAAAPTPIEPGSLEVHATLVLTLEVKEHPRR